MRISKYQIATLAVLGSDCDRSRRVDSAASTPNYADGGPNILHSSVTRRSEAVSSMAAMIPEVLPYCG